MLSRGLIDVLPDEASLATMLAHELSHVALGHQLIDTKFSFADRVMVSDAELLQTLRFRRTAKEEGAADEKVVEQLLGWLDGGRFDLIVSDIAPNLSGIDSADQAGSMYLLELALDTVRKTLEPGATFVAKMFQGSGSDEYMKELRKSFEKVLIRKPAASRKESREVYIVAKGFKG